MAFKDLECQDYFLSISVSRFVVFMSPHCQERSSTRTDHIRSSDPCKLNISDLNVYNTLFFNLGNYFLLGIYMYLVLEITLKGYCTVFQQALKSLEITGIVLSSRMLKTARKNSKGLKSYKEFKF